MPQMPSTFRAAHMPDRTQRASAYERDRGSARDRGYSSRWDKASKTYLKRNKLCLACQASGFIVGAAVTDHVVPHKGDQKLFWDKANWQPCCRWHHDVIKQKLEREFMAGRIRAADLVLTNARALSMAEALRL